jgi:hypothetical protein
MIKRQTASDEEQTEVEILFVLSILSQCRAKFPFLHPFSGYPAALGFAI